MNVTCLSSIIYKTSFFIKSDFEMSTGNLSLFLLTFFSFKVIWIVMRVTFEIIDLGFI
jgi:hypothetical protein